MFSQSERDRCKVKVRDEVYFYQRLHERGHTLFGDINPKNMAKECCNAIRDVNKSVFVEDEREEQDSTHHCIFISDAGGYVCLPCCINDDIIVIMTIKDIRIDKQPFWYVRKYNEIAQSRNLPTMNYPIPS